jgi:hypothetical protein
VKARPVRVAVLAAGFWLAPALAIAQHEHPGTTATDRWVWAGHGQLFLALNIQDREFTDFTQIESQNWGVITVGRRFGRARVSAQTMLSAEPWTLRRAGSAQVLQTGETLDGGPLLDYQHPHDLIMGLQARLDWQSGGRTAWFVEAGPVGAAALGPRPFMHRGSAGPNPTTPLAHHMLDSSHITHGVVTAGFVRGPFTVDASVFRGREPDEDRVSLDMGALDSVSARIAWQKGAWRAQVSSSHLTEPEAAEPGDVTRSTASLEYERAGRAGRRTAWLAAWGRNDRIDHAETGWLFEGRNDFTDRDTGYTRAEVVDRFILVDFDYAAQTGLERHLPSSVTALTIGYERRVWQRDRASVALGADVTLHRVSQNLRESYGRPVSWHLFARLAVK